MDDYLPHQRDKWPTNKWEEKYQGVDDPPKVDDIYRIHQYGNGDSYDGYIGAEVQLPDYSGNPSLGKVLKLRKGING